MNLFALIFIPDQSSTGTVTRYKFSEFLKGFGPLSECVKNVQEMMALVDTLTGCEIIE